MTERLIEIRLHISFYLRRRFPPLRDAEVLGNPIGGEIAISAEHETSRINGSTAQIEAIDRRTGAGALRIGTKIA